MEKEEKKAMKHLKQLLLHNSIDNIDKSEIIQKNAKYIDCVWQSNPIQRCFFQQNAKFSG